MATTKTNQAKFTAWTDTGIRMEATGSVTACALELFGCIHNAESREKILKLMHTKHEKLKEAGV